MDHSKISLHISRLFNKELEDVHNKVLTMGDLVGQQLKLAIKALTLSDVELAEQVISQDSQINALEIAINLECNKILAIRQPKAFDLRLLLAIIKIIHELERIGNNTKRIAEMAIKLLNNTHSLPKHDLDRMVELVNTMLDQAIDAFSRMSIEDVPDIIGCDEKVDHEYENIVKLLITCMIENPQNITASLDVLTTARALERIGDHTRHICEHLVFTIYGENVRHLSQKKLIKKIKGQEHTAP
jgi:phosphate transport system protein